MPEPSLEELKAMLERSAGMQITANTHARIGLVEIRFRGRFDIREYELLLSFDSLEMIYFAMLQAKMNARMAASGSPGAATNPVNPGTQPM